MIGTGRIYDEWTAESDPAHQKYIGLILRLSCGAAIPPKQRKWPKCSQSGADLLKSEQMGVSRTYMVMERWLDRFGAPREICSDRGPQFLSQYFQTLCSKIGARSTMCLAGRHQGNGKAENTGKQLRCAVAKALTLKKGNNWVEALPAVVRAWHETTGPSGYTPNEIVFGKHNRTKGPRLAEPKGVAQDAAHYFQRREELIALARSAMIQVQETMAHEYNKSRRMPPNF